MRIVDLVDKTFGRWTVLKYAGKRHWLCVCACGNKGTILGSNLRDGKSIQCRVCCPGAINKLPHGMAALNSIIGRYKANAAIRHLEWALARESAKALFDGDCFYCGSAPIDTYPSDADVARTQINGAYTYNGIDRIDPELGYIEGNCVSCCKKCNYMKRDYSVEEFYAHIEKIIQHKA